MTERTRDSDDRGTGLVASIVAVLLLSVLLAGSGALVVATGRAVRTVTARSLASAELLRFQRLLTGGALRVRYPAGAPPPEWTVPPGAASVRLDYLDSERGKLLGVEGEHPGGWAEAGARLTLGGETHRFARVVIHRVLAVERPFPMLRVEYSLAADPDPTRDEPRTIIAPLGRVPSVGWVDPADPADPAGRR